MLEDLHIGVAVSGSDGRRLGTLQRIVVERDTYRVTHLVVDPGLLDSGNLLAPGGWDRPRARILPISLVVRAASDHLTLSCDEAAFQQLSFFEREAYVETSPPTQGRFRLGELLNYIASVAGVGAAPYEPSTEEITFNEPAGSAEIAEGTPVWRMQPHVELGRVEHLLVSEDSGLLTALVIRPRGLGHHAVLLPLALVTEVADGVVHVTLSDEELDGLEPYRPEHEAR